MVSQGTAWDEGFAVPFTSMSGAIRAPLHFRHWVHWHVWRCLDGLDELLMLLLRRFFCLSVGYEARGEKKPKDSRSCLQTNVRRSTEGLCIYSSLGAEKKIRVQLSRYLHQAASWTHLENSMCNGQLHRGIRLWRFLDTQACLDVWIITKEAA